MHTIQTFLYQLFIKINHITYWKNCISSIQSFASITFNFSKASAFLTKTNDILFASRCTTAWWNKDRPFAHLSTKKLNLTNLINIIYIITNFSNFKIAEDLDFCLIFDVKWTYFRGKTVQWQNADLMLIQGKQEKNCQFYITVCFIYLASDLLCVVRWYDGKQTLVSPKQKRNPIFFTVATQFFFCL